MEDLALRDDAYVEVAPREELQRHVACVWFERHADGGQARSHAVADGFVDLIFGKGLWVRGPDMRAHPVSYPAGSRFVGIRFRPGAARPILGVPACELADDRVFLRDLWGTEADELATRLEHASDHAIADVLQSAVARRIAPPDSAIEAAVVLLRSEPRFSIRSVAERLGLSERQLLRRSRVEVGYGPKTLQRILRLQRFLGLAARGDGLARLAFAAGYSDQAHLTRECRRMMGRPPSELVRPFSSRQPS